MADEAVVRVHDVWRRYRVASPDRRSGLRASITHGVLRRRADRWFWALQGVDLSVHRGEVVGLIGRNGAGKSTFLRLLGGVGRPDRGSLRVEGRIGALVDLGHELHVDLTGRQNVELAGVIAGLTRREVRERFDEIIAFAELADFVDEPLRAYSDGMRARLAFAAVAHLDPDVLLVDEALSVGDAPFQRRAAERMLQLQSAGVAVVVVSHDLGLVRRLCDRAVWLDHGQVMLDGAPQEVVRAYLDVASADTDPTVGTPGRTGTIRRARLLDGWDAPTDSLDSGASLVVEVDLEPVALAEPPLLRVRIVRAGTHTVVVDTSTPIRGASDGQARVSFQRLDLAPGEHDVQVTLFEPGWAAPIDEVAPLPLAVRGIGPETALLNPPHEWSQRSPAVTNPR